MTSFLPSRPSPLVPGYRLDRYELLCPIADGGMATVWLGRLVGAHGFAKLVAIKAILPKCAADPAFRQMFLDEARVASYIHHPNVGEVFDLGEHEETLYLVMEWLDSDSLLKVYRTLSSNGVELPPGVLLRIMADTCAGLHAAHELCDRDGASLNVVHRDISPQNILVTTAGVTKLIDFGIAKARNRLTNDTSEGVVKGKIQYMAPEQAAGKSVDRAADIWSIGAVLYRLLGGRPPYDARDPVATIQLLTSGKPPPALPDAIHPAIRAIVDRALSPHPDDRFATAGGLQVAIEDAMLEANLTTTQSEVRRFLGKYLRERAAARRNAIEVALKAAAQRDRLDALLKPSSVLSSGTIRVPGTEPQEPTLIVDADADTARPHVGNTAGGAEPSLGRPTQFAALAAIVLSIAAVLMSRSYGAGPSVRGASAVAPPFDAGASTATLPGAAARLPEPPPTDDPRSPPPRVATDSSSPNPSPAAPEEAPALAKSSSPLHPVARQSSSSSNPPAGRRPATKIDPIDGF